MDLSNLREFFCLHRKYLVANMVNRNLKVKYRRSVLGIFWTLLYPMAMAAVYYFVFKLVLRVDAPHYLLMIMCGVLPWGFFSQSVLESTESIIGNWGLVTKVPIPVQVFPWVGVLTNFITLLLATPVILAVALLSGAPVGWSLMALPLILLALLGFTYAISLIAAVLSVWLRDLKHLITIGMQIWFYATPVLYLESMIPDSYRWIGMFNPLSAYFGALHGLWLRGEWPGFSQWVTVLGWTFGSLALAYWVRETKSEEIVEAV